MKSLPKKLKLLQEVKENPIDWEKEKIVSYSQFSTWKQCPHRWKLQSVDKLKSPPNMNLVFGSAIHTTLQAYLSKMYKVSAAAADRDDLMGAFEQNLREEYKKSLEKNGGKLFTTKEDFYDYFEDGRHILEFFQKKRSLYFSSRGMHLIGVEFPLSCAVHEDYPNVLMKGFIDLILYDESDEKIYIYDFKTTKNSWRESDKKDETKIAQILLYKEFFSRLFNWDIDKIEVEFFILKRKIYEDAEFPQKRVQQFTPPSGTGKRNKAVESFKEFIEDCFQKNGEYQIKDYEKKFGKHCSWCPGSNTCRLDI